MQSFGHIMFTHAVQAEQASKGSLETYQRMSDRPVPDALGDDEIAFIESRDSFYIATVSETGWPYVQHRGGLTGFLKVIGPTTLGFADYRGNRQFVSTGNLRSNDKISLFLMDYPRKARLKLLGHARILDPEQAQDVTEKLVDDASRKIERLFVIEVAAWDWNCPQYITPRFTEAELEAALRPRISQLAAENTYLKQRLAELEADQP